MRLLVALLAVLALVPAALAATDPRAEKQRLNAADMALAKRATLQRADLGSVWREIAPSSSEASVPNCPGYAPDFSRFTITGKSHSAFQSPMGATIYSNVEVYRSRAEAVGDFKLGARPALARCLEIVLDKGLPAGRGFTVEVVSSRQIAAPRVGERAAAYRLIAEVTAGSAQLELYVDVLVFQRGRSIGGLISTGAFQPVARQAAIARAVASRLR